MLADKSIRQAGLADLAFVKEVSRQTIQSIYPHYYPRGAVDYFLAHHSEENIMSDIEARSVFILERDKSPVGTVTLKGAEICRLFVFPEHQGNGYGRMLLDFSEEVIAKKHERVHLAASLPSKGIYIKRGYREIESHSILTENGDYLCYDVMEKKLK